MKKEYLSTDEKVEMVVSLLEKRGMSAHCGVCKEVAVCSKSRPNDYCYWLIRAKRMLGQCQGIAFLFILLVSSTAFAAKPITNNAPKIVSISPSSGTVLINTSLNFTCIYSDADGWQNLSKAYLLINISTDGRNCFYAYYDQNTNKFYLRDNANKKWLGGYAPGSANIIQNTYAILDCSRSSISGTGTTLSVTWAISFKTTFTSTKNLYLYIADDKGASQGWVNKGTCTITVIPPDTVPPTGTIAINNGVQYTNSVLVVLTLSAKDNPGGSGVSQMEFSNDDVSWSTPEVYATNKNWTLGTGDGSKRLYVKFKDVAGNWSQSYSDTIILDTTGPQITITSPLDNEIIKPKQ